MVRASARLRSRARHPCRLPRRDDVRRRLPRLAARADLLDRLHARRRPLHVVLRGAEPVHRLDAHAGHREQHRPDARRLGARRRLLLPADRPLVRGEGELDAAIKAFITTRAGDLGFVVGIFVLFFGARTRSTSASCRSASTAGDVSTMVSPPAPAPVLRRGRQVGPVPAARLAPGRDGRPDAGLGPDPRGHDGHGRRLHGGPDLRRSSARPQPR